MRSASKIARFRKLDLARDSNGHRRRQFREETAAKSARRNAKAGDRGSSNGLHSIIQGAKAHFDVASTSSIVQTWAMAKRIEEFFSDAEARLEGLDPDRREQMRDRLKQARNLIGSVDALERFSRWKAPSER